ncbi:hypothetical protein [Agrobacterium pusense]|uniref:hypothetical protein n=1 Tax=Agrobacterium pusense TaxID=648995 RepID=UPI001300453C|nr:hypothetical protein [Agrobacterium pusense]
MDRDAELAELRDQINGLGAVLSLTLSMMGKHEEICARLADMEMRMRQNNDASGAIEIVKSYRIAFQGGLKEIAAD